MNGETKNIVLGGVTYRMRPLGDADISALDQWLKSRVIRIACESLPENASEADRRLTMESAISFASSVTWMSGHGAKMLATIDGMAQIVWQGVRYHHPEVTPEEIRSKLLDPQTLDDARQAFEAANFRRKDKQEARKAGKRKNRKHKRKATAG